MPIDYQILSGDSAEFETLVTLEQRIWEMEALDAMPPSLLRSVAHNGALILAAYDGGQMIGFAVALVARHQGEFDLWSYVTGVHPDYQGQGIGFTLKQRQRSWALEQGYNTIRWTYDPLQHGNAVFNLHRLGVTANMYHLNYYGELKDALNAGLPSDRLEVVWRLNSARAAAAGDDLVGAKERDAVTREPVPGTFILAVDPEGKPQLAIPFEARPAALYAEIPRSINRIRRTRPALAYAWRMALREALLNAFGLGFSAVDFVDDGTRCWYVLRPDQR